MATGVGRADQAAQREASRRSILSAASPLFSLHGYRGTTTREIARRAGVSEMTLFRHFDSKVSLFDAAVLEPLRQFIDRQLTDRPPGGGGASTAEKMSDFLADLLALALNEADHPLLVVAAELAQPDPNDAVTKLIEDTMAVFLQRFEIAFRDRAEFYEFATDPALAIRIILGSVLSVAHHQRWLLPEGTDKAALVREMTKLMVWGLEGHSSTLE